MSGVPSESFLDANAVVGFRIPFLGDKWSFVSTHDNGKTIKFDCSRSFENSRSLGPNERFLATLMYGYVEEWKGMVKAWAEPDFQMSMIYMKVTSVISYDEIVVPVPGETDIRCSTLHILDFKPSSANKVLANGYLSCPLQSKEAPRFKQGEYTVLFTSTYNTFMGLETYGKICNYKFESVYETEWTPQSHPYYPKKFRESVDEFLLCLGRRPLSCIHIPPELVLEIVYKFSNIYKAML
jgi:hypothetical protein